MSTISALIFCEAVADVAFQLFPLHVLAHAHVKPQHGILSPLFLHAPDIGVLEQFPPSFEVSLKGGDKQGLAEPSRAAQEDILAEVRHVPDILRLVNVQHILLYDIGECLYADRQSLQLLLFHIDICI